MSQDNINKMRAITDDMIAEKITPIDAIDQINDVLRDEIYASNVEKMLDFVSKIVETTDVSEYSKAMEPAYQYYCALFDIDDMSKIDTAHAEKFLKDVDKLYRSR